MTSLRSLPILIVSDVVCPWCWVGRQRLGRALEMLKDEVEAQLLWHPYALNPGVPAAGLPRREFMESKFGSSGRLAEIHQQLSQIGTAEGIEFHFDRIAVQPNTLDAHRLIAFAADKADAVALALFAAFFRDGRDIGRLDVLTEVAQAAGLDAAEFLVSGQGREDTAAAIRQAAEAGVQGVPFYVLNGRLALSGAQPPEVMAQAIRQSLNV
jgi:predicted DsbA family dithiol-disulfide isomerase